MKINQRNVVTCGLTNKEVKGFEEWGSAMELNVDQAVKRCIAFTIQNMNPNKTEKLHFQ
jgi:hypothetical protein